MRILFTSDWQLELDNLDTCQKVVDEIINKFLPVYKFKYLVHCGDVKRQYNPVDVRVVNFILKAFGQFRKAGIEVLVNLGNHDRVGMHVDKQNWLPVLRKGGAQCFDESSCAEIGGSYRLRFLPFRASPVLLEREAGELSRGAKVDRDVLVFHSDLQSAKYNVNARSTGGVSIDSLCPERYMFCVGGHIHFQQNVRSNVWYVGSPFSTDWGEANQVKGYLLLDLKEKELSRIPSTIPHWFDPQWPGFWEPKSWQGARVRIRVPVGDAKHITEELRSAKEKAERRYRGAEILVIPDIKSDEKAGSKIRLEHSDHQKISIYTGETLPDSLKLYKDKIVRFLVEQLHQVGGLQRAGGELKFHAFRCENVLSFKKLALVLEPGLCVVTGRNLDRKGKSNGSGKTSLLQIPAIAVCGTTFKKQKHDAWMHRWAKKGEKAFAKLWFTDSKGRPCSVRRSRQPVDLKLKVNGEILESGNRPEETQKLIEQVTGYTWETLSNAIYVDQTQAHLMLTGTEAQRKGFLAKLQNLERFEKALKRVKDKKYEVGLAYNASNSRLAGLATEVESLNLTISQTRRVMAEKENPVDVWKRKKAEYEHKKKELDEWDSLAIEKRREIDGKIREEYGHEKHFIGLLARTKHVCHELGDQIDRFRKMEGECPTCYQPVLKEYMEEQIPILKKLGKETLKKVDNYDVMVQTCKSLITGLEKKRDKWLRNQKLEIVVADLRDELTEARERKEKWEGYKELLRQLWERKKKIQAKVVVEEEKRRKSKKWLEVIKYAETVFARDGLPAYLNAQICPQLNQSAAKYAELFTQREIQVQFAVDEEGQMDVQVINATGGATVDDQSQGELKVASLITSFAIREVAPKTNLLILDEPGDGLDGASARQFARGLKEIVGQYGTILLTSHNPALLGELASERMIVVEKKDGVSEVVE